MILASSWSPASGFELETNAMVAATSQSGCQLIPAGPGSGKTELLAQRADFLLRTGTCRYPYRILAISFKVDASSNLGTRVRERCPSDLAARFDSYTFHAFALVLIRRFRQYLPPEDALDSDFAIGPHRSGNSVITLNDLLPLATQILEDSAIARNAVRATYSDVFLDEFQDCNPTQYKLVKLCFLGTSRRLTAVGDVKQLIMQFALASDKTFQKFITDFQAVSLPIYFNHRSEPTLLRVQNEIIQSLDSKASLGKEQTAGDGGEVSIRSFSNPDEEAYFLANEIQRWIEIEELPFAEIAVLIPKQISLYAIALFNELSNRGIPFKNEHDSQNLTSEPLARLIIDYLLVTHGDREPNAYDRLMRIFTQISDGSTRGEKCLADLATLLREQQAAAQPVGKVRLKESVLASIKKLLNLVGKQKLVSLSADYESEDYFQLVGKDTIKSITAGIIKGQTVMDTLKELTVDQCVKFLTIHKCKGLEFHSVIILGVEEETFWGEPLDSEREFFVAVSRAKERLLLTHTNTRPKPFGANSYWKVSRTPHKIFLGYALPHVTT